MLRVIFHLIIAGVVLACTGCVNYLRIDGPYKGRVIDADTKLPIEGAVVHAEWWRLVYVPVVGGQAYYDSREVLTDKDGEFKIPGQGLLVMTSIHEPDFTIFKAGYRELDGFQWGSERKMWADDYEGKVVWDGGKPTFTIKRMTMEQRRKRIITEPHDAPMNKIRLFRREYNKENIEIGRDKDTLLPEE